MKKSITLLLAVLLALLLHVPQVNADELLVANGTATNGYVPVYGFYVDATQRTQIVYPAELLEDMIDGSTISQMQFYCTQTSISWGSARWVVKVAETGDASFSTTAFKSANFQTVYTGALSVTGGIMTVTFSTPFVYHGENLLLDFQTTSTGSYVTSTWLGVASNGAAAYSTYGVSTPSSIQNFLPKVTFTYVPGEEPDCWKAKHLSAENITANSAVLVWEDGGKSDGWYLQYRVAGDSASVVSIPDYIEETTYTLTGLNPTTLYEFRVITDCGGDPSDWTSWASFRTACGAISQLPFTEGFENIATGSSYPLPFCWNRFNDADTTAYSVYDYCPYVYSYASYAHNGTGLLYFYTSQNSSGYYSSSYSDHQVAVLPEIDVNAHPMNTLRMRFWAKRSTTSSNVDAPMIIGVMSDPADFSTFVAVDTVLVSNTADQEFTVYFTDYVGGGSYPAIRLDRQSAGCYCYVDDITIDLIPSCFRPTDVMVSDITANGVSVSWTPGKNETAWNIDYKAVNDSNATWTTVPVTASPYTLGNLTPNTAYELRMQSDCGSETSEWTNLVQFKTPCLSIPTASLPYTEDFESYKDTTYNVNGVAPDCWDVSATGSIVPHVIGQGSYWYKHSGTKALTFYGNGTCYAVLPPFESALNTLRISFWKQMESASSGTLVLGYITASDVNMNTFTVIETVPSNASSMVYYERMLNNLPDSANRLVFKWNYSSQYSCCIDDITVSEIPNCLKPTALAVDTVTDTSATLSWTNGGMETAWNIRYRVVGDAVWTNTVAATSNPFTLTGLTANTHYEYSVQANCGDEQSEWPVNTVSFRTDCSIITVSEADPYIYGFEDAVTGSTGLIPCWSKYNDATSTSYNYYPYASTSSVHSGSKSAYFYTGNSSSYPTEQILIFPEVSNALNTLRVTFWAKASTSSYSPKLQFGVMTDPTDPTTFTKIGNDIALTTSHMQYEFEMSEYDGNGYFAIRCPKLTSTSSYASASIYVDDVEIAPIPSCYPVASVSASGVSRREFTVNWAPSAAHAENMHGYQLVIDTVELDDDALAAATSIALADTVKKYKFTRLYRNTTYYVYVRPNCGIDDGFGAWRSISVKTNAAPAIPCPQLTNFRVDSITANAAKFTWTASTADYVGDYNLHISTTEMTDSMLNELGSYTYTGADNSYYPTDLAELTQYYAYVRVNCTDGDVDDGASVWTMVPFKTNSSCPAPESVAIDSVEKYSMRVNWVMPAAMVDSSSTYTYDVEVRDSNEAVVYSFTNLASLTRSIKVTNLMRNTLYNVYVRTNCGDANSPWVKASATTRDLTPECISNICGYGSSTAYVVYTSYGNSYTQHIYTAAELQALGLSAGPISGVEFEYSTDPSTYDKEQSVYIGTTEKDKYASTDASEFVSGLTLAYGPQLLSAPGLGWYRYEFATPFVWDGVSNIVVGVLTNQPSGSSHSTSSGWSAHGTNVGSYRTICRYKDNMSFDVNDLSGGYGTYSQTRPNINFVNCYPAEPCPALRVAPVSSDRTHNSARLTWTDAKGDWANTYELYLDTVPMNDSVEVMPTYTGIDTLSYVATGLASGKTYYAYVRVKCDKGIYDDGISGWSPAGTFETELPCLRPSMLTRSHVTSNSVDLTWLEANGATAWDIELSKYVPNDTAVDTIVNVIRVTDVTYDSLGTTVNYTLTGLDAKTFYSLRIRTQCEALSQWGYDVVNFTTISNNTDIDTIAFSEYYGNVPTVISYNRNGDNFDIVVRADASLEDMHIAVGVHDYNANVKVNGEPQNYWTGIDFNDETPVVFTVIAQDTDFRHDYNVFVHHETCATPYDIAVTNIGRRNATITWNIGATDLQNYDYVVAYEELSDPEDELVQHFADTLKTHEIVVDRDTTCYIYFRHSCGLEQSEWISTSFRSKGLENCDNYLTIGSASSTSQYVPGYTYYSYALSCQIYTPSEIGQTGKFTSLYFKSDRTLSYGRTVKIYMAETDKREFTSNTDWFKVSSADLVYDGSIHYVNGWNEITLSRPFTYSGTKNLVIVYDDNSGSYETGPYFSTFNDADGKNSAIYYYDDYTNLNPETSISTSASGRLTLKNQIKLGYCVAVEACPEVENLHVSDYQATEVTLEWTSNADYPGFYDVYVSETQVEDFTMVVPTVTVRETMATVTGLTQLTHYYVYVRTRCDRGDGNSEWAESEFTTQANCYAPLSIASAVTGKQTAHVAWVPGTDQQANNFAYVLSTTPVELDSLDMMAPTAQGIATDYVDLNGLASATHYYFYVHNDCGEKGGSPWVGTEFTTPAFQPQVINLEVSDITYNTFVASWERDSVNFASETEWQIAWAPVGETPANWTNVTETSRMIFGLAAETEYVFYVRPFENGNPGNQATADVTTLADPGNCTVSGTGTSTSTYFFPGFYGYQYAAELYDIPNTGSIVNVQVELGTANANTGATMTVWVKEVAPDFALSASDKFSDFTDGATEIFNGDPSTFEVGWVSFPISGGLNVTGGNQLLLISRGVGCTSGGGCSRSERYTTASNKMWQKRKDTTDPGMNTTGDLGSNLANVQICYASDGCAAPKAVAANNITTTSADITWRPGGVETEWEYVYAYAPMTDDELAAATATAVTYPAASLANLTIDADVYVYVRSKCGDDDYSAWANGQFRTIETCSAPVALYGYSVDENQMTMTVRHGQYGDTLNYTYEYWMVGSTDTMTITGSDTLVVNGLEAGTYTFRAKATCQTETPDGISRWTNGNTVSVCGVYNISDTKNYVQGFEGIYSVADACMTAEGDYQAPYINNSSSAHSGSQFLYFYNYYSDYGYESFVSMPKFNSNEEIFFSFFYKNYSTSASYGQFIYGYQTADGTFYPVETLDRKSSYTQVRRSLNELPDSAVNVALKFANGYYYGYLDDIRVAVQRESTINDTLAGIDTRYDKNGFNIYRSSFKAGQTDTVLTRIAQNGVVDSMYTLNLHLGSVTRDTLRDTVCPNVPYTFYTKTIDNPRTGWYYDTLATGAGNNVIHALRLTVLDATIDIVADTQTVCGSYNWRGRELTKSGVYYDTVREAQSCDMTIYELTLTVNPTYYVSETMAICQGSSYLWRGRDLTIAGIYYDSLQTVAGCDSIYELTLIVNPTYLVAETMAICQGSSYSWHGRDLTEAGVYVDTMPTVAGCDSICELTLTVNPTYYVAETIAICQGTSYAWHGRDLTEAGVYVDTVQTVAGCDSVCELTLTVNPTYFVADEVTIFDYELPYNWRGRNLTEAGVYFDTLQTVTGCDSVLQMTLTVNEYVCVAPTNLVAERTGLKSFKFSWENPTIGTEDEQANYFTYLFSETAVDPDSVLPTKTCRTVTTISAIGSLYNNEYHFYVKNVSHGVSSEWIETTISSLSQYPEVGNLTVENVETKAVTLSWTRHQYGTEAKWKVDVALKSDSSFVKTVVANNDTFRITGLEALTEYIFTVSPRINSSTFGDPVSVDATTLPMPAAPVNLVAELIGVRDIRFSWENGAEVTPDSYSYKVSTKFIDMNKDKYNDNPTGVVETTSVDLMTMTYATKYYLYVRCNVGDATSDWSMVDIKTGQKNPPVTNLHAEDVTPTSLTAVWTKNQFGTEPRWIVVLRRASDDLLIDSVNTTVQNHAFTGLERGTEYILKVYPRYNGGATGLGTVATKVVKTAQTCEAPINLTVNSDTYRYLTFNWENPTLGTPNEEPNNFTIIFRSSSEPIDPDEVSPKATGLTEATYSSEKLTKGATYYFYVRNEYEGAVSEWVGPIVFTVPATAPTQGAAAHDYDYEEESTEEVENVEFITETVVPAEAYVNMDKLYVENLVEGSDVMIIDASGRMIYNAKVNDTRMEYNLYVRGIYMVVVRGKQEQTIKVVY